MYAIVTTGGKQYKVAENDIINVEKLDVKVGEEVEFCTSNSAVYLHLNIIDVGMRNELRTMVREYIKGHV